MSGRHRDIVIGPDDPRADDVVELLNAHLEFARQTSPPDHVHALDLDGLDAGDITFCSARANGDLLAIGALRDLGDGRAEIKSMHTSANARGLGIGRRMLDHLIDRATDAGCHWIGLETGSMPAFAPARHLYATAGFVECEPFGAYSRNEFSVCMARTT